MKALALITIRLGRSFEDEEGMESLLVRSILLNVARKLSNMSEPSPWLA